MAEIALTREEEEGRLPRVCMCCGAPATERIDRKFPLHPPIVDGPSGFLEIHAIRVLLAAAQTPYIDLRTTFCPTHRDYWRKRSFLQFGGLAGMFVVLFIGIMLVVILLTVAKVDAPWLSACVIVPFLIYLIPWLVILTRTMKETIKVRLADDESVILCHVDDRYVAAVEKARRRAAGPQASSDAVQFIPASPPANIPTATLIDDDRKPVSANRPSATRRGKPNQNVAVLSTALGAVLAFFVVIAIVVKIARFADAVGAGRKEAKVERDVVPGTVVPNVPAKPPMPIELKDRASVDLIPLFEPRKDIVHGRWLAKDGSLHCNDGNFVPRVQFPYVLPQEYDFVVTFLQPGLRNGISMVMPNPNGGSFFWFLGNEGGAGYGFHGNPDKGGSLPGLIRANTFHTTKVEVRKSEVRTYVDGKQLIHLKTDYRDLTGDDWRKLHDDRFPAVACDDATVFYWVSIVEVTGQGKKAR